MMPFISIVALLMVFFTAIFMFGNELYYRKRVSACGVILLVCTVFLLWYFSGLSKQLIYLATELGKYQQVDLSKGL